VRCDDARAAISLRLDGEPPGGVDLRDVDQHVGTCVECSGFERHAERLRATLRFEAVDAAPDVAPAVLAHLTSATTSGRHAARSPRSRRVSPPRPRRPLVVAAALAANAPDPGAYAMAKLKERLGQYDFPVLLAAEWGHADRLLKLLDDPRTSQLRKLKVISLLGDMQSDEAAPRLKEALKDKNLAQQAAVALGNLGKDSIPMLIDIMKTSKDPELQAAAAKGLGQVGALHGDPQIVPPLLEMLEKPGVDRAVLTEVAWALGKLPDKRSVKPLERTQAKLLKVRDLDDPSWKKLFEAVEWSRKQCDTEDQFS